MKKNAMQAFSDLWRIEADCIYCKFCKRGIVQSRDGESFNHRAGCRNTLSHPWAALKLIINAGIAPAELHSEVAQERDKYLAWLKEIQGALIEHLSAESAGDHVIKSAKLLKTISEISDSMGEVENG